MSHVDNTYSVLQDIYLGPATSNYGLTSVSQRMHAVQAAALAVQRNHPPSLVVAALLHDVGHMVHDLGEHPAARGVDDAHELLGAAWLSQHFGLEVTEPVRLHVAAKRFLCTVEPDYFKSLSRDSVESLALQGGTMSPRELEQFEASPHAAAAMALRRIDDLAKDPHGPMPQFASFRETIESVCRRGGGAGSSRGSVLLRA